MSSIQPYRQNAIEVSEPTTKQVTKEFGLIAVYTKPVKPPPPHICNPPGKWARFVLMLKGSRVGENSLYRCHCSNLFEFNGRVWKKNICFDHKDKQLWVKHGGTLSAWDSERLEKYLDDEHYNRTGRRGGRMKMA